MKNGLFHSLLAVFILSSLTACYVKPASESRWWGNNQNGTGYPQSTPARTPAEQGYADLMDPWMGAHRSEVMQSWGTPNESDSLSKIGPNGEVAVISYHTQERVEGRDSRVYYDFYFDRQGYVVWYEVEWYDL